MGNDMGNELDKAIQLARNLARVLGEAHVVVEDAEEPDYYHVLPLGGGYPYSMLGTVVSIEYPEARK